MMPEQIIGEIACLTGIPVSAITGRRSTKHVVLARDLCCGVLADLHWLTREQIGHYFKRHHSTVSYAIKRHEKFLASDADYRKAHAGILIIIASQKS